MRKKKEIPPLSEAQKQAVTELYQAYKGLMLYTVRQLTSIPEETEEVMQDSLIALMRNIQTVSSLNRCKTAAYIVLTVRRTYYNYANRERRILTVPYETVEEQAADALGEAARLDADARLDVMHLMDTLDPNDRRILEAWYLEGCSAEQLAQQLHCKPDSVRAILSRVRKRAAKLLKETEAKHRGT
ncbi:MAG: sigma-70 family RNA polymerase sigma factor [Oscillospiraceae bacterium]|nr:sigma-70 family RNA polymerase sigma factor [Oscillospiraceae bacterium]